MMNKLSISLLDPSVCSTNIGDNLIITNIVKELDNLFPDKMLISLPTHEKLSKVSYLRIKQSKYTFLGGTNLLSSNMYKYRQWNVGIKDTFYMNNIILMGVGWWQYQRKPGIYTRWLLRSLLSNEVLHSVRDSYTMNMLRDIGIENVIHTSCPTLWGIDDRHTNNIPVEKASSVVFTIADYHPDIERDNTWIRVLDRLYDKIFFFPQGAGDQSYFEKLEIPAKVKSLPPKYSTFQSLLRSTEEPLDYIGTRLHGGIKAIQNKRRTLILAVDNRATEIAKDVNLNVISRENIEGIEEWMTNPQETKLNIPFDNIEKWKRQFK